jgi:hypothetical protein
LTLPTVGERRVRRPGAWRVQDEAVFPLPNSKPPFWRTWVGIGATVEVKVKVEVVRDEEVMAGEGVLAVTDLGVGEELLSMELDAWDEVLEAVLDIVDNVELKTLDEGTVETLTTDEEVARADDVDKTAWLEVAEAALVETGVDEEAVEVAEGVTRAIPGSS